MVATQVTVELPCRPRANPVGSPLQPCCANTKCREENRRGGRAERSNHASQPRRGRGSEEEQGQLLFFSEMANVLAGMRPRDNFRAPTYSGEGDVELFLAHFDDVAVANRWGGQATLLHLRAHLEGSARACGAGRTRDRSRRCVESEIRTVSKTGERIASCIFEARCQVNSS